MDSKVCPTCNTVLSDPYRNVGFKSEPKVPMMNKVKTLFYRTKAGISRGLPRNLGKMFNFMLNCIVGVMSVMGIIMAGWFAFPGLFYVGRFVCDNLQWWQEGLHPHNDYTDPVPAHAGAWVIGVIVFTAPYTMYLLGRAVRREIWG